MCAYKHPGQALPWNSSWRLYDRHQCLVFQNFLCLKECWLIELKQSIVRTFINLLIVLVIFFKQQKSQTFQLLKCKALLLKLACDFKLNSFLFFFKFRTVNWVKRAIWKCHQIMMNIFHYCLVFYSPNDYSTNQEKYRPSVKRKTFEKSWKLWPLRTN